MTEPEQHFDPADWIESLGGPEAIVARLYADPYFNADKRSANEAPARQDR